MKVAIYGNKSISDLIFKWLFHTKYEALGYPLTNTYWVKVDGGWRKTNI